MSLKMIGMPGTWSSVKIHSDFFFSPRWWMHYQLEVYSQSRYEYDAVLSITAIQMVTTSGNLDTQAHVLHMTVCVTWALIWERTGT
jgi:hypothetical protein